MISPRSAWKLAVETREDWDWVMVRLSLRTLLRDLRLWFQLLFLSILAAMAVWSLSSATSLGVFPSYSKRRHTQWGRSVKVGVHNSQVFVPLTEEGL